LRTELSSTPPKATSEARYRTRRKPRWDLAWCQRRSATSAQMASTRTAKPLEKSIEGTEAARSSECEDKPRAALFHGVADEHRGDREKAESRKTVHRRAFGSNPPFKSASRSYWRSSVMMMHRRGGIAIAAKLLVEGNLVRVEQGAGLEMRRQMDRTQPPL
jgi:hypothetical protein